MNACPRRASAPARSIARTLLAGILCSCVPAGAATVEVTVDASLAEQALGLVCTGRDVDEAAVRASPLVQAQIEHNSRLRETATMDAYVAALRAASACTAPEPDPFGIGRVIREAEQLRAKVDALVARGDALSHSVAARLTPYLPADYAFTGAVVLAVPYFSCGGFSAAGRFFTDVACLDDDIESDWDGLALLVAHEIFHVIQERLFWPLPDPTAGIATRADAYALLYAELLIEGSAELVAHTSTLPASGGGRYTRFARSFNDANARRMPQNFALTSALLERVAARRADVEAAAHLADAILFSGQYEEIGYYVGAQMLADIDRAWGREALTCIMRLPPEQLVLAHDALAAQAGDDMLRLGAEAVRQARELARTPGRRETYRDCIAAGDGT